MAIYFIFSAFNYTPVSLLATNEGSVFHLQYVLYICALWINIVGTGHMLMCCIQFQSILLYLYCTFLKGCTIAKLQSHVG